MVTDKTDFTEHFIETLKKNLAKSLPKHDTTLNMLQMTRDITNHHICHLMSAIYSHPDCIEASRASELSKI